MRNNQNTVLEQAEHCSMVKHAVVDMLIRQDNRKIKPTTVK